MQCQWTNIKLRKLSGRGSDVAEAREPYESLTWPAH